MNIGMGLDMRSPFGVDAGSGNLSSPYPFLRSLLQDGPWNMETAWAGWFVVFFGL
jgi:hypothetical protein